MADYLVYGLGAWLLIGIILLIRFRIFSVAILRNAPTRQSALSVPIVGGVILLYIIVANACVLVAVQAGLMAPPHFAKITATSAPAVIASTQSTTASAPATQQAASFPPPR